MDGPNSAASTPRSIHTVNSINTNTDLENSVEKLILRWDPSDQQHNNNHQRSSFSSSSICYVFDDRDEAYKYLSAIDQLLLSNDENHNSVSSNPNLLQIAMARLEDEFRNILLTRSSSLEIDSLLDLNSLSLSSVSGSIDLSNISDEEEDADLSNHGSSSGGGGGSFNDRRHRSVRSGGSYRSASGIREIDVVPVEVVEDLRAIAERMVKAGFGREVSQAYSAARKPAIDSGMKSLGIERLSIGDVQRLDSESLESKIRRWIRSAKAAVRILFSSERRLSDSILGVDDSGGSIGGAAFGETVRAGAIQLLSLPEAISIGRRSPEKLFKILDLHDAIAELLPDLEVVFKSRNTDSVHNQAEEIKSRLAEAVRGILLEFEHAVLREPSKVPVPGGTIHPLTRYVMNYISLISDYKTTLAELIVSRPSAPRLSGDELNSSVPDIDFPEFDSHSPLAAHLIWIIVILQHNMENKANLYKDASISHLFLMNNVHYIVNKVKGSPELRELIGDEYLRRLTTKFRHSATSYQRATWVKILHCLRDEGIHVSGSFSSGVSKSTLRERFKSFNASFDEAHRTQALWQVPDAQLREELRISISERLLPAYRSFLGRFRHHIESGRHPEMYIKYSPEDLEMALADFFRRKHAFTTQEKVSLGMGTKEDVD